MLQPPKKKKKTIFATWQIVNSEDIHPLLFLHHSQAKVVLFFVYLIFCNFIL